MEAQELQERLGKILDQNEPENCLNTMPKDLLEAFDSFAMRYAKKWAFQVNTIHIVAILAGTLVQGFWLGHDYALEHGQLRGD